jgi:lysophospholipase L1-like esterase
MFQSYLKQRDFKNVYFVKVGSYGPLTEPKELEEYYINNWIPAYDVIDNFPLSTEDELHLSQEGHERLASLSYKYIK